MKILKLSSLVAAVLIVAACHTTKKTETSAPTALPSPSEPIYIAPVSEAVKSKNGVFVPGEEQVTAVQMKHPGATLANLTDGYKLYTGTCTNCHGTKSIYRISEAKWQPVIDDMSEKAKLTATEKEALTKYIFAIKATQPAPAK
jgi:cytochrome c5